MFLKYSYCFASTFGCYKPLRSYSTSIDVYSIQCNSDSTQTNCDPDSESAAFQSTDSSTDSPQTDSGSISTTLILFHFIARRI